MATFNDLAGGLIGGNLGGLINSGGTLIGDDGNNTLDGGPGANTMQGGAGNDTYYVDNTGDKVIELWRGGTDTVFSKVNYTLNQYVENLTLEGATAIFGTGNDLANTIIGNDIGNQLSGMDGEDLLKGMGGDDTLSGGDGADILEGGDGNDTLYGYYPIAFEKLADDFDIDTLRGGKGNDIYYLSESVTDNVQENPDEGLDTLRSMTHVLATPPNVEDVELIGFREQNAVGNQLDNRLVGNRFYNRLDGQDGADTLDGGRDGFADTLIGGNGNDTYLISEKEEIVEKAGGGIDTVYFAPDGRIFTSLDSLSFTLPDNVENIVLKGTAESAIGNAESNLMTGNDLANQLFGMGGNDTLDGGLGADRMEGGQGDDTYFVDNAGDKVIESANQGLDTVRSRVNYTLSDNVENLILEGDATQGTGNGLSNTIRGGQGKDTLFGLGGDDVLDGGSGADTLYGGSGNDIYEVDNLYDRVFENINEGTDEVRFGVYMGSLERLADNVENITLLNWSLNATGNGLDNRIIGNALPNILTGGDGNDWLDGGGGIDSLIGGRGDDVYVVDNSAEAPREYDGEGVDTVRSSVTFFLADNFENLVLTGNESINGYGNGLNNNITGNDAANTLVGGGGNDVLDGGKGVDLIGGGLGSDRYYVDNAGDQVLEDAVEKPDAIARIDQERPDWIGNYQSILGLNAYDWVFSTINYTLSDASNIEVLALRGKANINASGNNLDNGITGNGGDNILKGLGGNDALWGGAGADRLEGGEGDDWLDGGYGHDVLIGGAGRDVFDFGENFPIDPVTRKVTGNMLSDSHDIVMDFVHGEDKIALSMKTFAAFSGLRPGDSILTGHLRIVTSTDKWDVSFSADADDFLIYDRYSGKLWYDANGNASVTDEVGQWSGKRLIATFVDPDGRHPQSLDYTDFMLVA